MITDADVPLSVVFGLEELPASANRLTPQSVARAATLVQDAVQELPSLRVLKIGPDVLRELAGALRTPLSDIVCTAWNKRKEICKYADLDRYPPTTTYYVWLAEHQITQTLKPSVKVLVLGVPMAKLNFTASVTLTLHGSRLVVRAGKITHIQLGEVTAATQLRAGKVKLFDRYLKQWQLPGELALGDGLAIRPAWAGVRQKSAV